MRFSRSMRWVLMAVLVTLIPVSSHASVFISVGIAPPPLPVYVQPPCPAPGMMWTPGYWAYGPEGYYWVPGAWVPAPFVGALWTPGYWGWASGMYAWHPGYWGRHVGYYGGVNYGFGYMGVGFVGGMWHGGAFAYNTAVMRVNRTVIHNTYINRTIVTRNTIVNNRRIAFSGGPGGINHPATAAEMRASREQHITRTSFQARNDAMARGNRSSYFNMNHGRPNNLVAGRPLGRETHAAPAGRQSFRGGQQNFANGRQGFQGQQRQFGQQQPGAGFRGGANSVRAPQANRMAGPGAGFRPQQQYRSAQQFRGAQQYRGNPQFRGAQHYRGAQQYRPAQRDRGRPQPGGQDRNRR